MKRIYLTTALVSGAAIALVTQLRYAGLAREIPQLLIASDPATGAAALPSQAWVGPSLLIPGLTLVIGIVAGWAVARGETARRWAGARAGAAAGLGALVGVVVVFTTMLALVGADPAVQAFVRASEPHPEARLAAEQIRWLGAGIGATLGLAVGAQSWAAAIFGGAVVDVLRQREAMAAARPTH